MTSNKNKSLPGKVKSFCLNLLLKALLYILGASLVLIVVISTIPSLFIYLLIGNYGMGERFNKKCNLPVNCFNE